jgi:hypothetical protein
MICFRTVEPHGQSAHENKTEPHETQNRRCRLLVGEYDQKLE